MTAPALAIETDYGRVYRHPVTREEAPSVTNVIGMISKPKLVGWAAKMAADYAVKNWDDLAAIPPVLRVQLIRNAHERYTAEKGSIGDTVHTLMEFWAQDKPYPIEKVVTAQARQVTAFIIDTRPEFIENEVTLWSRSYGYAGTADFIARIGGEVLLCDLKTGRSLHDEVGLQLAALKNADFILRPDGTEADIPPIAGLAALHVRPRSWKLVTVNNERECFRAFLAAKELYDWQRYSAPGVLGAA